MSIRCDEELEDQIARDTKRIQRSTARMSRLVGDMLEVVSVEAGRLALVPSRHDAGDLLRETSDAFQSVGAAKNISIRTEVRGGSLLARYDHDRVLQVLANVVGNAVKLSRGGGGIDVTAENVGQFDEVRRRGTACLRSCWPLVRTTPFDRASSGRLT